MKKIAAEYCDCVVCFCPYCHKEVIEVNGSLDDLDIPDAPSEGVLQCNHCGARFEYYFTET